VAGHSFLVFGSFTPGGNAALDQDLPEVLNLELLVSARRFRRAMKNSSFR
jgi:hypothetical protein